MTGMTSNPIRPSGHRRRASIDSKAAAISLGKASDKGSNETVANARDPDDDCGVVLLDEVAGPVSPLSWRVVVHKMIALTALVFTNVVAFDDGQRKTTTFPYAKIIGYETGGGMDGMIISRWNVGQVQVIVT